MRISNPDRKNWWYYHKWYVLPGAVLFLIVCSLIGNALGLFTKSPDLQIAYVGSAVLPQDTVNAIQETFSALAGDYNRDGEVMVQVNQYILHQETADAETAYSGYASWTAGKAEPFENADGDTVDLFDAQLYLLAGEFTDAATAEKNLSDWLAAGRSNYEVSGEQTLTRNGQVYTVITYRFINEENPYSHGISAFGVNGNLSVCVELTCREEYGEDLTEMLTTFLDGCSYQ